MDVPHGWEKSTVGAVASVTRGASPRPIASPRWFDPNSEVRWVRIGDVNQSDGRVLRETTQALSQDGIVRSRYVEPGTLIMSIAATVGVPVITGVPACIHDGFVAMERLHVDKEFLLYLLKASEQELRIAGQSGSQMNVNTSIVKSLAVVIPSDRREQARIAAALADTDDFIASLERLIAKKRAIKQGMMQELLTGRTRLPGFSGAWCPMRFGEIASPARERVNPQAVEGRVIELEHLGPGTGSLLGDMDIRNAVSLKSRFLKGDVLFGKLRAYLRKYWLADRDGFCSTEIWALRAKPGVSGGFVRYVVEQDRFIEAASTAYGTHMPRSDWNVVEKFDLLLPTIEEQAAIVAVLSDADAEIAALERRLKATRTIKQGMMQELLTGRTRLPVEEAALP